MRAVGWLLLGTACSSAGLRADEPVPDFELVDVNPTSPSTGQSVAPLDHRGHVSAWYFGHST